MTDDDAVIYVSKGSLYMNYLSSIDSFRRHLEVSSLILVVTLPLK